MSVRTELGFLVVLQAGIRPVSSAWSERIVSNTLHMVRFTSILLFTFYKKQNNCISNFEKVGSQDLSETGQV